LEQDSREVIFKKAREEISNSPSCEPPHIYRTCNALFGCARAALRTVKLDSDLSSLVFDSFLKSLHLSSFVFNAFLEINELTPKLIKNKGEKEYAELLSQEDVLLNRYVLLLYCNYIELGIFTFHYRRKSDSIMYFLRAFEVASLLSSDDPVYWGKLQAESSLKVAETKIHLRDYRGALKYFEKARDICEDLFMEDFDMDISGVYPYRSLYTRTNDNYDMYASGARWVYCDVIWFYEKYNKLLWLFLGLIFVAVPALIALSCLFIAWMIGSNHHF
jgi:tetratricopeptide (TPR) repeat protein